MGSKDKFGKANNSGESEGAGQPLMVLKGSMLRTNEWRPNVLSIFSDRLEVGDPGFLKKRISTLRFDQVARVYEKKGMKYTELMIESTGGGQVVANGLSKAEAASARQLLEELISAVRRPVTDAAPPPAPPIDIAHQIRKLDELRTEGLLSDAEFEAKKTQLLDRM